MAHLPKTSTPPRASTGSPSDQAHYKPNSVQNDPVLTETPEVFQARHDFYTRYPNNWSRIREHIRAPAAEALGCMLLTLLGCGVNCQVTLSSSTAVSASPKGDYLSVSFIWAVGLALGVWVSGGISGGHCNPVVTLALAIFRDFPWKKVPGYFIGQFFGAWLGALLVYANYFHAIDLFEGGKGIRTTPGTASLFGVYTPDYLPAANAFFDEFLGTFILVLIIFAVTDKRNNPPPSGLVPLAIFVTILGLAGAFGMQTGFALNPARDLGPRIMTSMVGYGHAVYNYRSQFWIWCPLLGPVAGGLTAAFVYDLFLFVGVESWINRQNASARRFHGEVVHAERQNAPAGRITDLATGIV